MSPCFQFPFVTTPIPIDPLLENQISNYMILTIKTKSCFPRNYKQKLAEQSKLLQKEFTKDMVRNVQVVEKNCVQKVEFFDRLLQDGDVQVFFHIQVFLFTLSLRVL